MSGIEKLKTTNIIKDLFTNNNTNSSTGYMNGIKAISLIIIVVGHSHSSFLMMAFKSGKSLLELDSNLFYQPLGMTAMMMEAFFIIGGILTAMSLKKEVDKL